MTKSYWAGVMAVAFFLAAGAGTFVFLRLQEKETRTVPLKAMTPKPLPPVPPPAPKVEMPKEPLRNIRFTLFSSAAKKPAIVGDFNKWYRQAMKKGKGNTWLADVSLKPGSYEYMFIVQGKKIRDPYNKKTSKDGNSVITVKPLNKK